MVGDVARNITSLVAPLWGVLRPAVVPLSTLQTDSSRRDQDLWDADEIVGGGGGVLNGGLKTFTPAGVFRFGCELHETIVQASGNPFVVMPCGESTLSVALSRTGA
jgi:hypothetical protein